jgi:hypothetical protein
MVSVSLVRTLDSRHGPVAAIILYPDRKAEQAQDPQMHFMIFMTLLDARLRRE